MRKNLYVGSWLNTYENIICRSIYIGHGLYYNAAVVYSTSSNGYHFVTNYIVYFILTVLTLLSNTHDTMK